MSGPGVPRVAVAGVAPQGGPGAGPAQGSERDLGAIAVPGALSHGRMARGSSTAWLKHDMGAMSGLQRDGVPPGTTTPYASSLGG